MTLHCPTDPSHAMFVTTAHEVHDWLIDAEGSFIEDLGCIEVSHGPDSGNTSACYICGSEATS